MVSTYYFPALSSIFDFDDLPDSLSFLKDIDHDLLDAILLKKKQITVNSRGDTYSYNLGIIVFQRLQCQLFDSGLYLVLNPQEYENPPGTTEFDINIDVKFPLLSYLRGLNIQNLSLSSLQILDFGLSLLNVQIDDLLFTAIQQFEYSDIQRCVSRINSTYSLSPEIALDTSSSLSQDDVDTLIGIIETNEQLIADSIGTLEIIYNFYLDGSDGVNTFDAVDILLHQWLNGSIVDRIKASLLPTITASLTVGFGLEIPRSMLIPVDNTTFQPIPITDPDNPPITTLLFDRSSFTFSTNGGFGFDTDVSLTLTPTYSQIGNTGIIISFTNAKLDLSSVTNILEADAAGYPVDFVGVYIQSASISFGKFGVQDPDPAKPSASITATNMLIGTGGISGKITLEDNGILNRKFNSFSVALDAFSLTFLQNTITDCNITGHITLDKYTTNNQPSKIAIQVHIKDAGDFSITALPSANFPPITFPGVFTLNIRSLTFGEQQPKGFYIEVAGTLDFIANIPVLGEVLPKGINITKLRIWDDGDIEFAGGGLVLPKAFTIKIGPVKMEVSHLSVGSYSKTLNGVERRYRYIGFDGMLNTGSAGVSVAGNGIKYYFTTDDGPGKPFDNFIRIDGIDINIIEPGNASPEDATFILKGHLSVSTPDPNVSDSTAGTEYFGSVAMSLPKLGISGSAGMRLDPAIPSFVVDIGLEFSTALPLGPTGLGIYGFRGLLGKHYLPSKKAAGLTDDASWWDYYKAPNHPDGLEGVELDKFAIRDGLSLGAGITIATEFDAGFTFSCKLFLLLGLPEVFLLQGQAGVLRTRIGLFDKTDPPFSALIAIDSKSFTGNLGVNYHLPSGGSLDGKIFTLQGTLAMAFFFNNASGWYLNLGQDQPESLRIQAKILTLFKGYAYVMISAKGFKAGAGAGFNFDKSFGPVGVKLAASLDLGAMISFKPIQIGGFIQFGGEAGLKIFWFKIGLAVQIYLGVEAPHPFNITGSLSVKIHTPWPLPNIHFTLSVSWTISSDNSPLLAPIAVLDEPDATAGYFPATALNIMSGETFPINYVTTKYQGSYTIPAPNSSLWKYDFTNATAVMQVTVPLDSYIDIELLKPVAPGQVFLGGSGSQLPMGNTEMLPPVKGISNPVKHSYSITELDIHAWNAGSGSWVPYHVYEAVTAIVNNNTGDNFTELDKLPPGYWQFTKPNTYNKIRLLSQTMFAFTNKSDSNTTNLDALNFKRRDIFCFDAVTKWAFVTWLSEASGTNYDEGDMVMVGGVSFGFNGLAGSVTDGPGSKGLSISTFNGKLLIEFPEAVTMFKIHLGANKNSLAVHPIAAIHEFLGDLFGRTISVDVKLTPMLVSPSQEEIIISYDNINQPVKKVQIEFTTGQPLDFNGNLVMGGYCQLPDQFLPVTTPQFHHEYDAGKTLMYVSLFNKSFSQEEVLQKQYSDIDGIVGQWHLNSNLDSAGTSNAIISGSPDPVPGYYQRNGSQPLSLQNIYSYTSNTDGLVTPFNSVLKVESGSFAFEVTAIFNPYQPGISTLLSKVNTDPVTGFRKGYALHFYQQTPGDLSQSYTDPATVPTFDIWFTCYDGLQVSGIKASALYTLDFTSSKLLASQYKHILVSVDRTAGVVEIYVDRLLIASAAIPAELAPPDLQPKATQIIEIDYLTEALQASQEDNNITAQGVENEVEILGNNLNKTIQPVWRPDTTFAITISTTDTVNSNQGSAINYTQIFGFRTAGPIGLFQQQSAIYQNLLQQDRADEFKVANLRGYIDFDRSFPDAQGRYNLSKPVLYHSPQISLFFTLPYINAMYSNWDSYQGLSAVQSSLQVTLLDPFENAITPELVWSTTSETIDDTNYTTLPQDQQLLYLMQAATEYGCNEHQLLLTRNIKKGAWQFPDLSPGKLYTAIFNAVYQPAGQDEQTAEVHKYTFLSSIFATFQEQAASFILDATPGAEKYALYPINVAFTADQISQDLTPLLNSNPDGDSPLIAQYAVQFDRIIYGGLKIKAFEPSANTIINPVINTDPESGSVTILGIIIRNPEPFNDPKMPADKLADTIQATITLPDSTVITPDQLINIYSGDTSAVLITNAQMQLSTGSLQVYFRYKIYNGTDYDTVYEDYRSDGIEITAG
ncbi:hypothetical protein [Mucilaginibacter sp.]|uniref:hypothetical protein n=1 Tax=Mucilaginibacter sp. TaxID=1882438 RepID=UPI0026224DAE|nr:hypothetical protein [Mucilaginibacter sp.]MDB4922070.1 hypothetical protein [Mucilaginibacter sp.]